MPMPFDTQFEDEPIGPLSRMSAPVRKADGDSVRATTASGKAINRGKSRMDQETGRKPLNIVKEEGGQWINNTPLSVESQLEDAYKKSMIGADHPTHNQAINNWIDRNLNKYIKKQMGTSKDPIRLLAEQNITHFTPENYGTHGSEIRRRHAGYDPEGVGVSPQAKLWENVSDRAIDFKKAGEYAYPNINDESRDHYKYMNERSQNPWLAGLPPETKIYETNPETFNYDLGFEHIIDILSEDLATGRLQTEDLKNVSIDRAVRRAHEYNQELNAELDAAKAQARKDLPVHKEYQDGYKWIQLNKPGSFAAESQAMGHSVRGYEPPRGHPDWIEASGDAGRDSYGHGGWEAIKGGKAKIYSLIDKSGEPHVTIETKRYPHPIGWSRKDKSEFPERDTFKFEPNGFYGLLTKEKKQVSDQIYNKAKEDWLKNGGDPENHFQNAADELVFKNPEDITQIKRKSNRVADEDHPYKPYIQDFIKSGNWDDIKDIANASMYGVHDHPEIVKKYGTPWITQEEYDESFNDLYSGKPKKEPGMKKGGSFATNIAQMRHELGMQHKWEGGTIVDKIVDTVPSLAPVANFLGATRGSVQERDLPRTYKDSEELEKNPLLSIPKSTQPLDLPARIKAYQADPTGRYGGKEGLQTMPISRLDTGGNWIGKTQMYKPDSNPETSTTYTSSSKAIQDLYKHARLNGAAARYGYPAMTPEDVAAFALKEGRTNLGHGGVGTDHPEDRKFENMIRSKYYLPENEINFLSAMYSKNRVANKFNIPFAHAWNGTGVNSQGQTGKEYAASWEAHKKAAAHPKNKQLMEIIQRGIDDGRLHGLPLKENIDEYIYPKRVQKPYAHGGVIHMNEGGLPNGLESPNPYDEAPRLMSPNDQPLRSDIEVERFKKDMMQRSQLLRKASPDDIRLQLNAQAEMGEKDRGGGTRIGALIPVNLGSMGRLTINPFTSGQAFKGEGQKSQGHWNKPGININWQKQFDNGGSVKGKQPLIPKKTVKAYKLFRVDEKKPGKLFPLFVDANSPVEKDQWVAAKSGEMSGEKVKSKIGPLAYRPGWHAGDLPVATHIGGKSSSDLTKPDHRPNNQVWAEVEMPNDVDWQSEANKRGTNKQGKLIASRAHITDQIPEGGHYRYKTNPNMTGNWLIGGAMKVNRVLPDKEVQKINKKAKVADLPREEPIDLKRYGFRSGGGVQPLIPRFKD